nr:hypothetical protein [Lachnospiraceae bacterium]
MAINISPKSDYSMLFSSLQTNSNNVTSSIFGNTSSSSFSLSDYALIKSGSYGKLMKAYYAQGDSKSNTAVNKLATGSATDSAATITSLKSSSNSLNEAAAALTDTSKKSVFEKKDVTTKDEFGIETTSKEYDTDAIYDKVADFVKSYNSVVSASAKSDNTKVLSTAANMVTQTLTYEDILNKVGITIGEDNNLAVDEKKFKESDMSTVKSLMNGVTSFAYNVQSKASFINMYAQADAAKTSGIYAQNALYSNAYSSSGYMFDSMF